MLGVLARDAGFAVEVDDAFMPVAQTGDHPRCLKARKNGSIVGGSRLFQHAPDAQGKRKRFVRNQTARRIGHQLISRFQVQRRGHFGTNRAVTEPFEPVSSFDEQVSKFPVVPCRADDAKAGGGVPRHQRNRRCFLSVFNPRHFAHRSRSGRV